MDKSKEDFFKKYSDVTYLGDGIYIEFEENNYDSNENAFILRTYCDNGSLFLRLKEKTLQMLIDYKNEIYESKQQPTGE